MARIIHRRAVVGIILLIVAAIFLPPLVNISRFKPRIAGALSRSLGRQVSIGSVALHLFPTPSLKMAGVVVEDDPAFSDEAFLRAEEVDASFRITSLWRGRLEIAKLSLLYPSVNVVRRPDGRWNLESLFERARQVPVAPTTRKRAEQRPRFPYIESDAGRVNLKLGREKTVWALSDADFAVWLEREDEWNLRLKARAIRTDANLSDTGTVKLSGTVRRAASLNEMPVDLHFTLDGAQLGQLSTLVYGRDRGWRGTVDVKATLKGTPGALQIASDASVADFRRYDIATAGSTRLATSCTASFNFAAQQVSDALCHSPIGDGFLEMSGEAAGISPMRSFGATVKATNVPASTLAMLARHMKKDLPEDVRANGVVSAHFEFSKIEGSDLIMRGSGTAGNFVLQSRLLETPLELGTIRFEAAEASARVQQRDSETPLVPVGHSVYIRVSPDLGGKTLANVTANISRSGYMCALKGDADLKRLLQISESFGIAAPRFSATGTATVDLALKGEWSGFAQPLVTGTAAVKATAPVTGLAEPVQITSAKLTFAGDSISVQDLAFGWPREHVNFAGSLSLPRRCTTAETCPVQFKLRADALNTDDVVTLLTPDRRPWYSFFGARDAATPVYMRLSGSGHVTIGTLRANELNTKNASADVSMNAGLLRVDRFVSSAFDGDLSGTLRADLTTPLPKFEVTGKIQRASVATISAPRQTVARLSAPAQPGWGTGKLDAVFAFRAEGRDKQAIVHSATGNVQYVWRDGTASFVLDRARGPLQFTDFRGNAILKEGVFNLEPSRMSTPSGIYTVSGTASLDRQLALTFSQGNAPVYDITGTLDKPLVSTTFDPAASLPVKETRVRLK